MAPALQPNRPHQPRANPHRLSVPAVGAGVLDGPRASPQFQIRPRADPHRAPASPVQGEVSPPIPREAVTEGLKS